MENHVHQLNAGWGHQPGVSASGAGSCTRLWAILVTFLVLACGALCFSRFFHQTGPSWLDSWTLLQNVAAHPMVFILLQAKP